MKVTTEVDYDGNEILVRSEDDNQVKRLHKAWEIEAAKFKTVCDDLEKEGHFHVLEEDEETGVVTLKHRKYDIFFDLPMKSFSESKPESECKELILNLFGMEVREELEKQQSNISFELEFFQENGRLPSDKDIASLVGESEFN